MNLFGTIARGVKAPIIKKGDNLVDIVYDSVISACKQNKVELQDKDIVAVTEAVVGKSQGNYATLDQISKDVRSKFGNNTVGLVFPILSRNRFSLILKGIAGGVDKLVIQLSYPQDEVGNPLFDPELIFEKNVNPYTDVLSEKEFRKTFGDICHPFTGVDYIKFYKELGGKNCEIIFSNKPKAILKHTPYVIAGDIHTRERTKRVLLKNGAKKVVGLDDILKTSVDGSGFHPQYGVLGSNMSTDSSIKLFPKDCDKFVLKLQKKFLQGTGKNIECMVYGDGAFKDPVAKIWELADPVVSPGFTAGLEGTPNEIKLKYIADNKAGSLNSQQAKEVVIKAIKEKEANLVNKNVSLGTTPRRYTDLLGSLCDLTSGSGDKGTPIVLIQNYFTNYAD